MVPCFATPRLYLQDMEFYLDPSLYEHPHVVFKGDVFLIIRYWPSKCRWRCSELSFQKWLASKPLVAVLLYLCCKLVQKETGLVATSPMIYPPALSLSFCWNDDDICCLSNQYISSRQDLTDGMEFLREAINVHPDRAL